MTDVQDRWLSVEEICQHLGVSSDTVYRWIDRSAMPAHKMGRKWKFKRDQVSDRGPYPYTNGYEAQNPVSSASGAYQFLDSTWRNAAAPLGYGEWSRAKYAPWWVQDAVAYDLGVRQGGRSHWAGSGC